ncbi:LysE family translocator [Pseudonocardia spinosispora]|uniref:LysE family translocator n=1 Tax=Pseudonocardia spinosispora TaxID=103441 RepID=UPI000563EB35|nr:LysE family translocator [Pseudonocardia spinosispora]
MHLTGLLTFIGVSAVVIMTPGPDTAVTIRGAFAGGRAAGIWTALGVAGGQLLWSLATSVGLVAVLTASEPLFLTLKYAGVAYLIFLGGQALLAAARPVPSITGSGTKSMPPTRWVSLSRGLLSDLGNPKMAVFFVSLPPQFAPSGHATMLTLMALGTLFAALTFIWLATYAAVTAQAGDVLRRPSIRRVIEAMTGTVLIGLGARIATE